MLHARPNHQVERGKTFKSKFFIKVLDQTGNYVILQTKNQHLNGCHTFRIPNDYNWLQRFLNDFYQKQRLMPWLVWLSGLSASLQTEGLPVQFQVRAHAWVAGQVPGCGCVRGNRLMFLFLSFSLPFPLSKKIKLKKKILEKKSWQD